ncbi:MAG: hypothetical protein C0448_03405 [Sphingobacteriaceae bacterium]|nr:hypothetical protein [Sphingobacteriaceae bacterium]
MQKLLIYICIIFLVTRCAQITPLSGGKKDITAPKVLSYNPENASLNFNTKTIEILFDEYITLKDIANQFIITPQVKEIPEIQTQGKKLKITFNETLLPNTTYKLAFGNAISDLNESNVLQNFEYIFSTGSTIDSLKLQGKIFNSLDKKPESQILVGLYSKDSRDSVVYKEKPLYISKTNLEGVFYFNYLPNTPFKIVAIKDQNKNLLYDGSEEQLAFTKELVHPGDSSSITLNLFKEKPSKSFIKKSYSVEYGKTYIIYNKPQTDIKTVAAKGLLQYKLNVLKDTLSLYYNKKFDTLEVYVNHENQKVDTVYIKILSEASFNKQTNNKSIKYDLKSNLGTVLAFFDLPSFELNVPVESKNIHTERIELIEKLDSASNPLPFILVKDTGFVSSFKIQATFKQESNYELTIKRGAITDNGDRTNDSTVYKFKTTIMDDYALLKMKLMFPKKENYLVRLLNDKEQLINERVVEFSLTSTSEKLMEYNNLPPGKYFIRVVEDANKNGLFDEGNYFLNIQPEIIFMNTTPIKLLPGWEIENEWIVK